MDHSTSRIILFLNSSVVSSKNKNIQLLYSINDFCRVKNSFETFCLKLHDSVMYSCKIMQL